MEILAKYIDTIPSLLKPGVNTVINALIQALAETDTETQTQIANAKEQFFVQTASGRYLTKLGTSRNVARPLNFGLTDAQFRNLIPTLSFTPKQIKKAFYAVADVLWTPLISRANVTTTNSATFNLSNGDLLYVKVDGGVTQTLKIRAGDIATGGAATAAEVVAMMVRIDGITASIVEDGAGDKFINLRTDTPGSVGSLEFLTGSTMLGSGKLEIDVREHLILDHEQRFVVYPINPHELTIELPIFIPLVRGLEGSHHFHADATLESPVAPANGVWAGSFFYNPSGSVKTYTITGRVATLTAEISQGTVQTAIDVGDTTDFEDETSGLLLFGFGLVEEGPVAFRGVPNTTQILIDPTHNFANTHGVGVKVNLVKQNRAYQPRKTGIDLPIYFTSPSSARETTQAMLARLAAAGITINWEILPVPQYEYLISDPYL